MAKNSKITTKKTGGGLLGTGTHLFGSNPLIDNPLNPVYSAEQAVHAIGYTGHQVSDIANTLSSLGNTASGVVSATESVGSFLGDLKKVSTWIRVAQVLGGVILLIMGLRQLASVATGSQAIKGVSAPSVVPVPV